MMIDPWLLFLDVPMELIGGHLFGDIVAELINLFSDVVDESIARPPSIIMIV